MNIQRDSKGYNNDFSFVPQYGEAVMDLITAPQGSTVLDLGCGNGSLTGKLRDLGYGVIGLDDSDAMVELAKRDYPDLPFMQANALDFKLDEQVDVVFSNAVFHWIDGDKQQTLLDNVAANLKPGGELVVEFGGYGCAAAVHTTLARLFEKRGLNYIFQFYFPTIGQYAPMLEKAGFKVEYAILSDRPTVQKSEDGLADWIRMFDKAPFEGMDEALKEEIIAEAKEELYPVLRKDGRWFVDYTRIRFRARKL